MRLRHLYRRIAVIYRKENETIVGRKAGAKEGGSMRQTMAALAQPRLSLLLSLSPPPLLMRSS